MSDAIEEFQKAVEEVRRMRPMPIGRKLIVEDFHSVWYNGELVKVYFSDTPDKFDLISKTVWENFLHDSNLEPTQPNFMSTELFGVPIIRKGLYDEQQPKIS